MAHRSENDGAVEARILYWGIEGSGKSANLRTIHSRLRSDNRGELREIPTRLDPTVHYEVMPIELGEVKSVATRLQVVAVPGAAEQAPTRKQLLDQADGLVLVIDCQRDKIDENLASVEELRSALAAYGRSLESLPLVVQYNKHDLADPVALDALHRKLDIPGAAVFETVATEGNGALRTLTTISKRVMRVLRDEGAHSQPIAAGEPAAVAAAPEPVAAPAPAPVAPPEPVAAPAPRSNAELMEEAILSEAESTDEALAADLTAQGAQTALDRPWDEIAEEVKPGDGMRIGADMRIVSVGTATAVDHRALRVPIVLGNDDGESVTLALTLQLDPLLDGDDT